MSLTPLHPLVFLTAALEFCLEFGELLCVDLKDEVLDSSSSFWALTRIHSESLSSG